MKNAAMIILAAAVAVLVFMNLRQRSDLAALRTAHDAEPAIPVQSVKKPVAPSERVPPPQPDIPTAQAATRPAAAPEAKPPPKDRPDPANFMAGIGSMMTNPAMKQMIRTQTSMSLDLRYGRLFKFFQLTPEENEQLKALLTDRQMALMDSGLAFMGGKLTPEEQKQKAKELEVVKKAHDQKLKDLLGAEDYEALEQYEATEPERMQVDMLKQRMASSAEPLSEQQEYDLVSAMHQSRTNSASALMNPKPGEPPDPAQFTEAGMHRALADMERIQTAYAASAQRILTASQFAEYQRHADQQRQMNEMGMRFAAQMFGGGASNAAVSVSVAPAPGP